MGFYSLHESNLLAMNRTEESEGNCGSSCVSFTHSQDVSIQTALVINSIHARVRITTEVERILAVYDTQVSLGQHR